MARNRAYESIVETTFDTPLVRLRRVIPEGGAAVYLELEYPTRFRALGTGSAAP